VHYSGRYTFWLSLYLHVVTVLCSSTSLSCLPIPLLYIRCTYAVRVHPPATSPLKFRSVSPVSVSIAQCGILPKLTNQTKLQAKIRPKQIKQMSALRFHFLTMFRYAEEKEPKINIACIPLNPNENDVKCEDERPKMYKCNCHDALCKKQRVATNACLVARSLAREVNGIVRLRRIVKGPEGRMQREFCCVLVWAAGVLSRCNIRAKSVGILSHKGERKGIKRIGYKALLHRISRRWRA